MASRYLTEDEIRGILCEDSGSEGFISDDFDTDREAEDIIGKFLCIFCVYNLSLVMFGYVSKSAAYAACLCLSNYFYIEKTKIP